MNGGAAMAEIVFLLEGDTDKVVVNRLMERFFPKVRCLCIPHQGKNALQKSIPVKLRAWQNKSARFVVLHDQDAKDCRELKDGLRAICKKTPRPDTVVRIACKSLEAWYWGDLQAVAKAYPRFNPAKVRDKASFRFPDKIHDPHAKLQEVLRAHCGNETECEKGQMAEKIAPYMEICGVNKSPSFVAFVKSVKEIAAEL